MKNLVYLAAGLVVLIGVGNLFTLVLQDYFIFRPRRLPDSHRYSFAEAFEEVNLSVRRGNINGLWFRLADRQASKGVILYFHGNSGNLVRWGNLYHFFFRHQYDFFVIDYRGFGKSRGRRTEKLLQEDARAAYQFLRKTYAPEQIVLFGRSMGSAFASRLASEVPARLLILETPFSSMPDLFYTYYPFLPRIFWFKYRFPNREYLKKVPYPVYVFQGTDDYIVPYVCAARLQAVLKPGDAFFTIDMGRHNDLMIYESYQKQIKLILEGNFQNEEQQGYEPEK